MVMSARSGFCAAATACIRCASSLYPFMRFKNTSLSIRTLRCPPSSLERTPLEGLIEKVGNYAMEKKSISVEEVKENFSLENEQAEKVVGQLERIGVLSKEEGGPSFLLMSGRTE